MIGEATIPPDTELSPEWVYVVRILREQPEARLVANPDGTWTLNHTIACNMPTETKVIRNIE